MQGIEEKIHPKENQSNNGPIPVDPILGAILEQKEVHIAEAHHLYHGFPDNIGLNSIGNPEDAGLRGIKAIDSGLTILECILKMNLRPRKPFFLVERSHRATSLLDEVDNFQLF